MTPELRLARINQIIYSGVMRVIAAKQQAGAVAVQLQNTTIQTSGERRNAHEHEKNGCGA